MYLTIWAKSCNFSNYSELLLKRNYCQTGCLNFIHKAQGFKNWNGAWGGRWLKEARSSDLLSAARRKAAATEYSLAVIERCLGTLPSPVHTQFPWWHEAIFTTPSWDHKARTEDFWRRWGKCVLFWVFGVTSHPFRAQMPILLLYQGKSVERVALSFSAWHQCWPQSHEPWVHIQQCVYVTWGRSPLLGPSGIYKMSLYEGVISWSNAVWSLQKLCWAIGAWTLECHLKPASYETWMSDRLQ